MVDFHSHVLPGIDDGSQSVSQSVSMLRALAAQGVDTLALTPHFYGQTTSPEQFLAERAAAMERLKGALEDGMPSLLLGAEVYFFHGISRMEQLPDLRLQGTRLLLLEMPFCPWGRREVREVLDLCENPAFVVMLAHVERYLKYAPADAWDVLRASGAIMQSNAAFFLPRKTRGKALRMVRRGQIHVLGTDCHNMEDRRPCMDEAAAVLEKRFGAQAAQAFFRQGEAYLEEWSI